MSQTKKRRFKKIPPELARKVTDMIRGLLHASRDCLRTKGIITKNTSMQPSIQFDANDGYYCEAFGIMRCLELQNYGALRGVESGHPSELWDLSRWFRQLQELVLSEENYDGNQRCDYCLEHYGKDIDRQRMTHPNVKAAPQHFHMAGKGGCPHPVCVALTENGE